MRINSYFLRLLNAVKPYRTRIGFALLGMIGAAMTEPVFPYILKILIDNGFSEEKSFSIWMVPLAIVGIFFLRGICTFCTQYYMAWVANKLMSDMREDMFKRTLDIPISYYQNASGGRIINTIMYEVQQVVDMVKGSINTLIRDSITVLALFTYLVYQNWQLTIVALIIIPSIAYVVRITSRRLRHLNQHQLNLNNELVQVVEEATRASAVIRIFGAQKYEHHRFYSKSEKLRGYTQRVTVAASSTTPITQMVAAAAVSMVIIIAMRPSLLPFSTTPFSPGDFVAYIATMMLLLTPLKRLSDLNGPMQRGLIAAESVFTLIDMTPEHTDGMELIGRAKGDLEFVHTTFGYQGQEQLALKDVNLKVRAGETVALVGMSGGGKTSLVNMVPRFYAPTSGFITLDGHNLADLSLTSLRSQIAMVGQHVVLFDETLAANIAYGDDRPDQARIEAAVKAAHLTDVIANLPQGLQTQIGDNGLRLSGGQRQRVAIARAIYKNAPILILDEATSALDSESERAVQSALAALIRGRTTLVIAHRLSTIERADKIVVLTEGEIREVGTHAELLQKNGVYAHLYQLQFPEDE
ncbi:MAG: msbA [Solimicrobium sp.]|jgi:subfamily B ATP-binding cassette protein MsbA|nr:msbA [Solimicrobium sp.]